MGQKIPTYSGCFVCGDKNAIGLHAEFVLDGKKAVTELVAGDMFEGYKSIYHGGILATVLDEVMIKAILAQGIFAVTAEMTVRYHKPVATGDRIYFSGWVVKRKGRAIWTEGEALSLQQEKFASATGVYIEGDAQLKARLTDSLSSE